MPAASSIEADAADENLDKCTVWIIIVGYTSTTYMSYHHILNPSYSFSPIRCLISLYASRRIRY